MTATTWKLTAAAAALVLATAGAWGLAARGEPQAASSSAPAATPVPAQAAKPQNADAKQRARSVNNLKQIILALHNFHDANGILPHDIVNADGKPILSWRVQILPYIEQDNLYKQFKLDEPWDSENNKKLLKEMPEVFKVGIEPKDSTRTYYQGFAGVGTVFEPGKQIKIMDIPDGTSNTIAVVESGPAVDWTKPADLPYDPSKDFPKLDGPFANVLVAGFGDGSVHMLKRDIEEKSFRFLIERADGNPVDTDAFKAKFPVTKEELKEVQEILKRNEKTFAEIAELYREQQKLLGNAMKTNPEVIKSLDVERLVGIGPGLEGFLENLKKETEELRKELSGEKKDAPPPPVIKK